jgi:hypothetical protein
VLKITHRISTSFYSLIEDPRSKQRGTDPPPDIYRDGGELGEANALAGIQSLFIRDFSLLPLMKDSFRLTFNLL